MTAPGVGRILRKAPVASMMGEPAKVSSQFIELLRRRVDSGEFDEIEPAPKKRGAIRRLDLRAGDTVAAPGDIIGQLRWLDDAGRALLFVQMLGRDVRAVVDQRDLVHVAV